MDWLKTRKIFRIFNIILIQNNRPDGTSVRRSLLVRKVWGSNPEPIKSPTRCQRLATAATFEVTFEVWAHGAKPRRWAPLTRDTRKGNKRV